MICIVKIEKEKLLFHLSLSIFCYIYEIQCRLVDVATTAITTELKFVVEVHQFADCCKNQDLLSRCFLIR